MSNYEFDYRKQPKIGDILLKKKLSNEENVKLLEWMISSFWGRDYKKERPHLSNLLSDYKEKIDKIKDLELKINSLGTENSKLKEKLEEVGKKIERVLEQYQKEKEEVDKFKKENLRLKIVSGEAKSGWKQDRDMIERDNPETGKLEQYDCPINFKHEEVKHLKYLDEHRLEVKFYHHDTIENHSDYYEMPTDAYKWLKRELPEQQKEKAKKSKVKKLEFKNKEEIIQRLAHFYEASDKNIDGLQYLEKATDFLWEFKDKKEIDKKFWTGDFRRYCQIGSDATVDDYLDMFVECDIIKRVHRGLYKANF